MITALGGTALEGAGNYPAAKRDRLNGQGRWYGYPDNNADTGYDTVTRASFALAGYQGGARSLSVRVGCTRRGSPCGSTDQALIAGAVRGAEVHVDDPTAPRDLTVEASGLLRGGRVGSSDLVRVK